MTPSCTHTLTNLVMLGWRRETADVVYTKSREGSDSVKSKYFRQFLKGSLAKSPAVFATCKQSVTSSQTMKQSSLDLKLSTKRTRKQDLLAHTNAPMVCSTGPGH